MSIRLVGDICVIGDTRRESGFRPLEFAGYAAGFDVEFFPRSGPRMILRPGIFRATLEHPRLRRRIPILRDHDAAQVIGRPLELYEDARGLFVRARLEPSARTADVIRQMLAGELTQLSIGITYALPRSGEIRDLWLREISVVRAGGNPLARIASATVRERPYSRAASRDCWRPLPDSERQSRTRDEWLR